MTRNSNPATSGNVTGCMLLPELVIVSSADSPIAICDGWRVALMRDAMAMAGAAANR